MKKLLALLVLVALGLTIGCGGASGPAETAEGVVVAALEAMQSGDKDAFMSLAYPGDFEGGVDMEEYEEFWLEVEEEDDLTIDTWSNPVSVETISASEMEGDIIGGEIMETMVSISFGGEIEAEGLEFIAAETEEGWFIFEIDA